MRKQKKNTAKTFDYFAGWTVVEIVDNMYLPCTVCGIKAGSMYYRIKKGEVYDTTEVRCCACVGQLNTTHETANTKP